MTAVHGLYYNEECVSVCGEEPVGACHGGLRHG